MRREHYTTSGETVEGHFFEKFKKKEKSKKKRKEKKNVPPLRGGGVEGWGVGGKFTQRGRVLSGKVLREGVYSCLHSRETKKKKGEKKKKLRFV